MKNNIQLINILVEVRQLLQALDTDITWTHYRSVDEVVFDIDTYIEALKRGEAAVLQDLNIFFAPTGALQEISMSSGWGDKFLVKSSRFDQAIIEMGRDVSRHDEKWVPDDTRDMARTRRKIIKLSVVALGIFLMIVISIIIVAVWSLNLIFKNLCGATNC